MTDDEATLEQITKIGFKSIEVLEGKSYKYADDPQVLIDMLAKYGADMMSVCVGANFIYQDALEDENGSLKEQLLKWQQRLVSNIFVICGGAIRGNGIQPGDVELLAKRPFKSNGDYRGVWTCSMFPSSSWIYRRETGRDRCTLCSI